MRLKNLQEMTQLHEATGSGFFTEAKGYDSASDFSDEFYELFTQVTKMKKVMKNPKWIDYMKMMDLQQNTSVADEAIIAIRAITDLEAALNDIDREFDRAKGHNDDDVDEMELAGLGDEDGVDLEEPEEEAGVQRRRGGR